MVTFLTSLLKMWPFFLSISLHVTFMLTLQDYGGRAILILRNPYDAILSTHNFMYAGHHGKAPARNYARPGEYKSHFDYNCINHLSVKRFFDKFTDSRARPCLCARSVTYDAWTKHDVYVHDGSEMIIKLIFEDHFVNEMDRERMHTTVTNDKLPFLFPFQKNREIEFPKAFA